MRIQASRRTTNARAAKPDNRLVIRRNRILLLHPGSPPTAEPIGRCLVVVMVETYIRRNTGPRRALRMMTLLDELIEAGAREL